MPWKYKKQHIPSEFNFLSHEFNPNSIWPTELPVPAASGWALLTVQGYLQSQKPSRAQNTQVTSKFPLLLQMPLFMAENSHSNTILVGRVIISRKPLHNTKPFGRNKWLTVTHTTVSTSMSGWEGAARVLKEQEESFVGRERKALRQGSLKYFGYSPSNFEKLCTPLHNFQVNT